MDMTKFENEEDPGFVSVTGELRRWIKELSTAQAAKDARESAGQTSHAECDPDTRTHGTSNVVTHNGNNMGEAKVVYGGNMTSISSGPMSPA
jgi:hypothetical protein